MKVYVAFDGDYSARGVTAVFTSREKADECSSDVEEHELDDFAAKTKHDVFEVRLRIDDGALISSFKATIFESPNYCRSQKISRWAVCGVSSLSSEHALKLAAEERQTYLRECALVPKPGIDRVNEALK